MNRSMDVQGWAELPEAVAGTAETAEVRIVESLPAGTSQCYSDCRTKVRKRVSERTRCCGIYSPDLCRDVNAARYVRERVARVGAILLHSRHVVPRLEDSSCKAVAGCRTGYTGADGCQRSFLQNSVLRERRRGLAPAGS